jgi:hypothetical protein
MQSWSDNKFETVHNLILDTALAYRPTFIYILMRLKELRLVEFCPCYPVCCIGSGAEVSGGSLTNVLG